MCAYMTIIINIYLGKNIWNSRIPDIGNSEIAKILMGVHFVTGLICMYGYLVQPLTRKNIIIHEFIGIFLYICASITVICGLIYGIIHGTIGGVAMDIGLAGYGIVVGTFILVSSIHVYKKRYSDNYKKIHKLMVNIFGALIYGSVLYRIQYIIAALFNYLPPDNIHIERYFRPLDKAFVFTFYIIPLLLVLFYDYVCYYKYGKIKMILYIMATLINIFLGIMGLFGCLYYQGG